LGLGEIEKHRGIEAKRHRDRADNKNPEQSWVAQLVYDKKESFFQGFLVFFFMRTNTEIILLSELQFPTAIKFW
jgi:hypothetical protein